MKRKRVRTSSFNWRTVDWSKSSRTIARELGCPRQYVWFMRNRMNLTSFSPQDVIKACHNVNGKCDYPKNSPMLSKHGFRRMCMVMALREFAVLSFEDIGMMTNTCDTTAMRRLDDWLTLPAWLRHTFRDLIEVELRRMKNPQFGTEQWRSPEVA